MSRASPAHILVGALTAALLTQGSANEDVRRSAFGFASAGGGFTAMTGCAIATRQREECNVAHECVRHAHSDGYDACAS